MEESEIKEIANIIYAIKKDIKNITDFKIKENGYEKVSFLDTDFYKNYSLEINVIEKENRKNKCKFGRKESVENNKNFNAIIFCGRHNDVKLPCEHPEEQEDGCLYYKPKED